MILTRKKQCLLLLLGSSYAQAELLGPLVPAPLDLTSDSSIVAKAWKNLTSTFDTYLNDPSALTPDSELTGAENITWSTGLFSIHDPAAAKLQYHSTSKETANAPNGTNQVDGDSIYRGASISKLVTAYAGLVHLTDKQWHTPLSELIPGLGDGGDGSDPFAPTQWDQITPWVLANQQAGVQTLGVPFLGDLIGSFTGKALAANESVFDLETAAGFPPTPISVLGPCTNPAEALCSAKDFVGSFKRLPAEFLPWSTPVYSDFGLMLLGMAISNVTGKSYTEMYGDIFEPLDMSSTTQDEIEATSGDKFDRAVVAPSYVYPGSDITAPSGGIFTTINDLAKLGVGIMNSTRISSAKTRRWMRPGGHTASLTYSLGAPWEIVRYIHPDSGRVTDLYTKLGDSGAYGGIMVVIPDYEAGFTFLNAASIDPLTRGTVALNLINAIAEKIVPALEAQAIAEAKRNLVGKYSCADTNSSVVIAFNDSMSFDPVVPLIGKTAKEEIKWSVSPSLTLSSWISNGTDMMPFMFGELKPQLQLMITKDNTTGPGPVAFDAFTTPQSNSYMKSKLGPFSGFYASNFGWAGDVGTSHYAGRNAKRFVFDIDGNGRAMSVTPGATNLALTKVEGSSESGRPSDYIRRGIGWEA